MRRRKKGGARAGDRAGRVLAGAPRKPAPSARLFGLGLALVLGMAAPGGGGDPAAPPEAGVTVREIGGARVVETVLPGIALDLAAEPGGVVALVAPGDDPQGPRSLHRFDPSGEGTLVELAGGLPEDVDAVGVVDSGSGGRSEVVVGGPGRVYALDASGGWPRPLLEAPGLSLGDLRRRGLVRSDRAFIPLPRLGRLEVYRFAAGATPELLAGVDLPVRARRERTALVLSTPAVHLLDGDTPLFAVGPERHGQRRLLTTLVDPSAAEPEARSVETWAQLPAHEKVAQSWVLAVDGRPMLAVATLFADKLGIFEKKKLRVFPLRTDRTRAGAPPSLEIDTVTRNWYDVGVRVTDLDRDGRGDLAVVQPDGLGAKKLAVEVYRGQGNGGFFRTPRRSVVVAPLARWVFGRDVDGDRIPDLVVAGRERLEVYRGLRESKKKLAVEKKPRWSLEMPEAGTAGIVVRVGDDGGEGDSDSQSDDGPNLGALEVFDLGGDGRGEVLLRSERGGRTVLTVIELR